MNEAFVWVAAGAKLVEDGGLQGQGHGVISQTLTSLHFPDRLKAATQLISVCGDMLCEWREFDYCLP